MKSDCVEEVNEPIPTVYRIKEKDGKPHIDVINEDDVSEQEVIGATIIEGSSDGTDWTLTLYNGDNIEFTTFSPEFDNILKALPPAAVPNKLLTEDTPLWETKTSSPDLPVVDFDKIRDKFKDVIDNEEAQRQKEEEARDSAWKNPHDVSDTIAVRSSNYGLYEDQAAVELQIKKAFENTPNWTKLKPDARCALDMIATKASRILTGKPDLHDNWHDMQGYAKLVADRISRDIIAMGGTM